MGLGNHVGLWSCMGALATRSRRQVSGTPFAIHLPLSDGSSAGKRPSPESKKPALPKKCAGFANTVY